MSQIKRLQNIMAEKGIDALSVKSRDRYYCEENVKRLEIIKELSLKYEVSVAAIVCAALSSFETPDVFPIIGGSRKEQIADSMTGGDITLTKEELRALFKYNV